MNASTGRTEETVITSESKQHRANPTNLISMKFGGSVQHGPEINSKFEVGRQKRQIQRIDFVFL